ncbi:hypothetical protein LWI28_028861 [Acer negundo]|uniref:Uncharacterized protein n=1 Tax=Acer negundo TaxID=4023 RepID=A0AAD5J3N0_ACENE|nr:hypothetical protein LWI28_028861 [Acer negundo]
MEVEVTSHVAVKKPIVVMMHNLVNLQEGPKTGKWKRWAKDGGRNDQDSGVGPNLGKWLPGLKVTNSKKKQKLKSTEVVISYVNDDSSAGRIMNRVRIVISYNGQWEQLPDGSQRFVGFDNKGMYVSKNMTYEELVAIVHTIVKYDVNKFNVDLASVSIVPDSTCRTFIRNNDDVQFMLGED